MFYQPEQGHGLPHDPFKAIVAPRPIGWISSRAADGRVNLAPYSFFNALSSHPHLVWFSSEGVKDSYTFAEESGEFVVNLVSRDLVEAMNRSSADVPRGISEFDFAGLTPAPSQIVQAPRVAEAHAALECKVTELFRPRALDGSPATSHVIIGQVVGVHIEDSYLTDGLFDIVKAGSMARLGYMDYSAVTETFPLRRPRWDGGR
jgi:flavin reductase (DIM6/NTAB) family NADH-FMN oxidoreductase RutF